MRKTIGENPLDAIIPLAPGRIRAAAPTPAAPARPPAPRKVRATFHIPEDLLEAARNCVVALSGPPHRLTLADLATNAIRAEIERLSAECHDGEPFPHREDGSLRGGRPIGR